MVSISLLTADQVVLKKRGRRYESIAECVVVRFINWSIAP